MVRGGVSCRAVNTSNSGSGGPELSLVRHVFSLNKGLYSSLSLFTRVYKWVPATYCWGVTLRWTSIPSRGGGVAILLGLLNATERGNKLWPCGPLVRVHLYLYLSYAQGAPSQYLRALFGQKENFTVYFSRKKAIIITSKHDTTTFFSHCIFFLMKIGPKSARK